MMGRLNGQIAISRAFGDFMHKKSGLTAEPYINSMVIDRSVFTGKEILIIASDGVWDGLSI